MIFRSRATGPAPNIPSTRVRSVFSLLALSCSFLGCADDGEGGDDANGDSTDAVTITDANNYTSTSLLSLSTIQTAPNADLQICWAQEILISNFL